MKKDREYYMGMTLDEWQNVINGLNLIEENYKKLSEKITNSINNQLNISNVIPFEDMLEKKDNISDDINMSEKEMIKEEGE